MSRKMSVEIDGHGAGINFSAAHFLVDHEKCERIHGHNYVVSAVAEGPLDENGMVADFTGIKNALRAIVLDLDHRILLPGDGTTNPFHKGGQMRFEHNGRDYEFPASDVAVLSVPAVTAEHIAIALLDRLAAEIPTAGFTRLSVGVEEGPGQTAWAHMDL